MRNKLITIVVCLFGCLCAWLVIYTYNMLNPKGAWVTFYKDTGLTYPVWKSSSSELSLCITHGPCIGSGKHYSCRWSGWLNVPQSTNYTFATLNNGGIRLFIDDQVLIENWKPQKFHGSGKSANAVLVAGSHKIIVEYFCSSDIGRMRVEWCGGEIPPRTTIGGGYLRKNQ